MKRIAGMLAAAVLLVAPIAAADAPDLGKATFLIASTDFDGSPFEQAVIIAAPATNGRHIGFIINRRSSVRSFPTTRLRGTSPNPCTSAAPCSRKSSSR